MVPFRLETESCPTEPLRLPAALEHDCERGDTSDGGIDVHISERLGEASGMSGSMLRFPRLTDMLMV